MSDNISQFGFRWSEEEMAPNHFGLLRELVTHDVLWGVLAGTDAEGRLKNMMLRSLHWSRVFEWPWVLHHAELDKSHRVLDAGGGSSTLTFAVAARCGELVRLDLCEENLREAYDYMAALQVGNVTDYVGDVRSLPFPDASFDRVIHVSVLEHVNADRWRVLSEMKRVLKPGGLLIMTCDVVAKGEDKKNAFPPIRPEDLLWMSEELGMAPPDLNRRINFVHVDDLTVVVYFLKWRKPGG